MPSLSGVVFGLFEVNFEHQELLKAGRRIHLQTQPFHVLMALLERPGEIVTKDELRKRIWDETTNVDFDQSLSKAINKVREALGDSSDNPRFIETVPRRGYRFIAPLAPLEKQAPASEVTANLNSTGDTSNSFEPLRSGAEPEETSRQVHEHIPPVTIRPKSRTFLFVLSAIGLLLLGSALEFLIARRPKQNSMPRLRQLTFDTRVGVFPPNKGMAGFPSLVTDGESLFTTGFDHGSFVLLQASVHGGELRKVIIPREITSPQIGAISRRTSKLLISSSSSIWVLSLDGTSAQRIPGVSAQDETWMPDGSDILYSTKNELRVFNVQTGTSSAFAKTPGKAYWLRWSPSGDRLRFTVLDPLTRSYSLWEITANDHTPRKLLTHWNKQSDECCGIWMPDGSFIFQAMHNNESDLWRISQNGGASPEQLTNGPFWFAAPAASPVENKLFFVGLSAQAKVQTFNAGTKEFQPATAFLHDAREIDNSRDHQWIAWVDGDGKLWRARTDGRDRLQLSADNMTVYMARWSPDGSRIAMVARTHGQPWQLYLVRSDGSNLEQLLREPQDDTDPTWSPDGKLIMFGRMPYYLGNDTSPWVLRILNLQTHKIKTLPGSGIFSPHWSPDGKYVLALTQNQRELRLFNMQTRQWTNLVQDAPLVHRFFSNPRWSADSRAVYVQDTSDVRKPVLRIAVPDGHVEEICTIQDFLPNNVVDYTFFGLAAGNTPMVRTPVNGNLFSLTLSPH